MLILAEIRIRKKIEDKNRSKYIEIKALPLIELIDSYNNKRDLEDKKKKDILKQFTCVRNFKIESIRKQNLTFVTRQIFLVYFRSI